MIGCNLKGWVNLLRRYRFAISPSYLPRFFLVTLSICFFEAQRFFVSLALRKNRIPIEEVALDHDPIFILGYWRSGTTHLHNILELNDQFAGPGLYEIIFSNVLFKIRSKWLEFIIRRTAPTTRPMDNVVLHPDAVQEEEVAMLYLCGLTPFAHWVFPRERETCQKYFNFEESPKDYPEWKSIYLKLLKELSYTTKKRLLLKSPPHTGRILRLLELFPNAKFIHIHRNPYEVFLSNMKFQATAGKSMRMQTITDAQMEDEVIEMYKFAYGLFFRDVAQIPRDNFIEISYDELCKSPLRTVEKIYSDLHLDGFDSVKSRTIDYLASLESYEKNRHPDLSGELKSKIQREWGSMFKAWGYEL